jgi:peptidoglycan-associated lipoprotein
MKVFSLFLLVAALLISGCPPKTVQLTEPKAATGLVPQQQESGQVSADASKSGSRGGITEEEIGAADRAAREKALLEEMKSAPFADILFEFDSYTIKEDYFPRLKQIRDWLAKHRSVAVIVEGHCDERGTAEYNLALGQKRAETVKEYLMKGGIEEARIKTISLGKEDPSDPGHTEDAWAKNRRAHFKIERKG